MREPTRLAILLAFAALYVIWGSTYLFIRLAIDSIPPFLMAGSRYLTAGFLMYGIARAQGAQSPPRVTWRSALVVGGLLLLGGNGGVTLSEKYIDTGLAAVVVATVPIYIVLLSCRRCAQRRRRKRNSAFECRLRLDRKTRGNSSGSFCPGKKPGRVDAVGHNREAQTTSC